ncbi:MAG: RHS repeat-associated core domain-containing protein [Pseudomonas sp.]|nr:MAG: RHS repeat-associated core domain-containing protein [Pseudomonas sp.]
MLPNTTPPSVLPPALRFYQASSLATELQGERCVTLLRHGQSALAQLDNTTATRPLGVDQLLGNGHRAYSPSLMKFLSPDSLSPFGSGGLNAYAYCLNDPVNLTDPTGKTPWALLFMRKHVQPKIQVAKNSVDLASKALVANPNSQGSPKLGRVVISELANKQVASTPFTQKLVTVNKNLVSHNDATLTVEHAGIYRDIATQNLSGQLSNTSAHLKAADAWRTTETGAPRIVGVTFNVMGAIIAGAEDKSGLATN